MNDDNDDVKTGGFADDKMNQFVKGSKPDVMDEAAEDGSMPTPESDDNVLDNAHNMGLYKNADEEHPVELGLGEEVNTAEEEHQEN